MSITYPFNGGVFTAGPEIPVKAAASDDDGIVTLVEFFIENELIGQGNIPPYTNNWIPLLAGTYNLTARATDDTGLETVSEMVMVTVEKE